MQPPVLIRNLGLISYRAALQIQNETAANVLKSVDNEKKTTDQNTLLICQHNPGN